MTVRPRGASWYRGLVHQVHRDYVTFVTKKCQVSSKDNKMVDPVQPDPGSEDLATIRGRARWMATHLHDGKVNRLAAAIGVSGAAISRILGGKQEVGPRMVE